MTAEIAVVGAGVIGTTCANVLAADGTGVLLIDPVGICGECSWGNAGYIAPNLVFPIATLREFRHIPRYLFDRNGPLRFRWQHFPALLPWLLRFSRNSSPKRVDSISRSLHSLNKESIEAFERLFPDASQSYVRKRGELRLYESKVSEQRDVGRRAVWDRLGIRYRRMSGDEVRTNEPSISPLVHSALYFPDVAHCVDPAEYTKAIGKDFCDGGGVFIKESVRRVEHSADNSNFSLHLDSQTLEVEKVVFATGIHSRAFAAQMGHNVPLEAERGYHIVHPGQESIVSKPLTSADRGFVITPMNERLQLSGTVEFGGTKIAPDYERAKILDIHAKALLPSLDSIGIDPWMGMRPSLPDSLPVISESSKVANAFFAFGHQHLGLTQGATTAMAVDCLVKRKPAPYSLSPFRIDRF
ncbi:MAG: NAD(P)/FAD-dependent oxidoreductase [Candidatus Azotimanducaceae bacterium WSBS_2022_MAG_OTU7]